MAAFQGKHVSPVKHRYMYCATTKKSVSDYQKSVTLRQTDARQSDPYMYVCYALQATKKLLFGYRYNFLKTEWQHSEACMCRLRNIAMHDY